MRGRRTALHDPGEQVNDWQTAQRYLEDGNARYLKNEGIARDTHRRDREVLREGQKPFAVIITCADSRVVPEIYFDQKLGDIFVIRNAGNITDTTVLGSVEYAVKHLKAPLVVVVGHSHCGAVTGAFSGGGEYSENLSAIINAISPVIKNCGNLDEAIRANTQHVVETIQKNTVIKELGTTVMGAYYNIESGEVAFLRS
jgi:carbonic anhydrase